MLTEHHVDFPCLPRAVSNGFAPTGDAHDGGAGNTLERFQQQLHVLYESGGIIHKLTSCKYEMKLSRDGVFLAGEARAYHAIC